MSILKIENEMLVKLTKTSFELEKIYEVKDLQKCLVNSINIIDPKLKVISTEFSDWEDSNRSIDILCIDSDANIVVIEIKRTKDGGHMELQALRYSAMIANMKFEKLVKIHEKYLAKNHLNHNAENEILNFLNWPERSEENFNQDVKIILISASFSKEITTSVLWLNERDIDIRCFRLTPYKDELALYFDFEQIIPLPEAADYQVRLKEKVAEEREMRRENKRAVSIVKQLF